MHYKHLMASETLKEFREFILKGNAFDLAVGVIVGAAFGTIVTSLVGDILMPPIGMLLGNVNFSDYFVDLTALKASALGNAPVQVPASYDAAKQSGHAIIAYGKFLNCPDQSPDRRRRDLFPCEADQPAQAGAGEAQGKARGRAPFDRNPRSFGEKRGVALPGRGLVPILQALGTRSRRRA